MPAQKRSHKAGVDAIRAVAKELDAMIAAWGASEKEIRKVSREKSRMPGRSLVLDANILIRAVLGKRVRTLSSKLVRRTSPSSFRKLPIPRPKSIWRR
ncbi:MAG: hypothetical protein ABI822_16055 [Bryobacteraceae bacterium]